MPQSIKIARSDIINACIEIVRDSGFETLNARKIAKKLTHSTQPIFREFKNMEELKDVVRKEAWEIYTNFLLDYEKIAGKEGLSFGVAYVKFAKEEKNLFKLIFMANEIKAKNINEISEIKDDRTRIIEIFMKISGLCKDKAIKLHFLVWLVMHGVASMLATNQIDIADEEIKEIILNSFRANLKLLKEDNIQ